MMTTGARHTQVFSNFVLNWVNRLKQDFVSMEKIIEELRCHESQLKSQLAVLSGQVSEISEKLSQAQIAITALSGNASKLPSNIAVNGRSKSLDANEIQQLLVAIVKGKEPITKDALFKSLGSRISAQGRPKFGLKSKFEKAIRGDVFESTDDGFITLSSRRHV